MARKSACGKKGGPSMLGRPDDVFVFYRTRRFGVLHFVQLHRCYVSCLGPPHHLVRCNEEELIDLASTKLNAQIAGTASEADRQQS